VEKKKRAARTEDTKLAAPFVTTIEPPPWFDWLRAGLRIQPEIRF
jgi:hypothetical protein